MSKPNPLTDSTGEVRELGSKDINAMRGISTLPASLQRKVGPRGGQKAPTKQRITTRP